MKQTGVSAATTDIGALRARKRQQLDAVSEQLRVARERLRAAAIEYAATTDGACETYRRFELARGDERDELRAVYLAGLALAEQEYRQRLSLGHTGDGDGPLQAIPVGSFDDPVVTALVEHRVMGWVRTGPAVLESGHATAGLVRLLPDGGTRVRMRLRCPADPLLGVVNSTLAEIVAQAWADQAVRERLGRFLGTEALAALSAALVAGAR